MKITHTNVAVGLLLSGLICTTAACGGESLSGSGGGGSETEIVTTDAPAEDKAKKVIDAIEADPELNEMLPEEVRSDGIVMSTGVGYPPMEVFGEDGKTIVGLDPSLARAIANTLGVKISIKNAEFNSQLPGLVSGRYNMVMSSMTDTVERQAQATFVDYVQAGSGITVVEGNPESIKDGTSLCGKTVSVVDNGSSLDLAEQYVKDCEDAGSDELNILTFTDDQDALLAVTSGRAEASIVDYVVAAARADDESLGVEAIALDGTESPWGIGLNPENEEMVDAVEAALTQLIESGDYTEILEAWNLQGIAVDSVVINGGE